MPTALLLYISLEALWLASQTTRKHARTSRSLLPQSAAVPRDYDAIDACRVLTAGQALHEM